MQPRTTAWLALAALALGAFIYLFEIRGGEQRAAEEAESKRFFASLDAQEIQRLAITTADGQAAVIVREGERWQMVEPLRAPASPGAVDAILNALEGLEREGGVDAPADLEPFGLGPGAPRVRFEAPGVSGEIVLGRDAPVGAERYVLEPGSDRIDLVRSFQLNAFDEPLDDLRDKRVLPFEISAVGRVVLEWPGQRVSLERRPDGWWMAEPVAGPADASTIDTLLADVAFLSAEGFVDAASGSEALDSSAPVFRLRLEGRGASDAPAGEAQGAPADARPAPLDLEFVVGPLLGGEVGDGARRVARGRDGMLFAVAAERLDDWPRQVVAYRNKTLSQFDVSQARTFELVFTPEATGEGAETPAPLRIQAELAGGGWVSGPEAMAPDRAAALVAELAFLEGIDIVADDLGEAERTALGLRPPRVAIRVWGEGESGASAPLLAELSIGREQPGRGVLAKRRDGDVVYLLDPALAAEIPFSLEAFRQGFVERAEAGPEADADAKADADAEDEIPEI